MNRVPESFKEGWGDIRNELLAAYYVVGMDDKFLTEFSKDGRRDLLDSLDV